MDQVRELVGKILQEGYILTLGTVDDSGPWVCDLVFIHDDDFNLYWISQESVRHSQAILKNNKASANITLSYKQGEDNIGVQLEGIVTKIEGDNLELATKHLLKRKKPAPQKIGEILKPGDCWYKLIPAKIQLTYEPLWGFGKKDLVLK